MGVRRQLFKPWVNLPAALGTHACYIQLLACHVPCALFAAQVPGGYNGDDRFVR
jgi:hypothetical protein